MNRDEFSSLSLNQALGILYDIVGAKIQPLEAPAIARSPKFDGRISRKDRKFIWMSECNLETLKFYHKRAVESAAKPGQYQESNAKDARSLGYWVGYRQSEPNSVWSGERQKRPTTAFPPSRNPTEHAWEAKGGGGSAGSAAPAVDYGSGDDSDIPFVLCVTGESQERWWGNVSGLS